MVDGRIFGVLEARAIVGWNSLILGGAVTQCDLVAKGVVEAGTQVEAIAKIQDFHNDAPLFDTPAVSQCQHRAGPMWGQL